MFQNYNTTIWPQSSNVKYVSRNVNTAPIKVCFEKKKPILLMVENNKKRSLKWYALNLHSFFLLYILKGVHCIWP